MRSRILLQWLAGTVGGFLGWVLVEPCPWLTTDPLPGQPPVPMSLWQIIVFGLVVGACVSGCIGAAFGAGSPARMRRSLAIGAVSGAIGGGLGLVVGQGVYQTLGATSEAMAQNHVLGALGFVGLLLARSAGWAGIGAGLGILQGAVNGSWPRSRNGLIGGLLGGFFGGLVFELMTLTVRVTTDPRTEASPFFFLTPEVSRAVGLTLTGSAIGLFVGLTERFLRRAWVRVRLGRNEGLEYMLEKPVNTVGRDELSDVPLFGDMQVVRQHATISGNRGAYVVDALAPGVAVNGQPVQRGPLQDGDILSVAGHEIEFHQKGAPRAVAPVDAPRAAVAPPPVPEGICPYCGQRKDAAGGCACSPAAAPPAAPVAAPYASSAAPASSPPGGAARLAVLSGPYAGKTFPLGKPEVTMGREADRDIALTDDTAVSRRHARLLLAPSGVDLVDEGSSNGTFVNGTRVQRQTLHPGDEVRVGNSVFRVEAG